jgi:hypothetical protein
VEHDGTRTLLAHPCELSCVILTKQARSRRGESSTQEDPVSRIRLAAVGYCSEKHRPETPDCLESGPEHEPPVRSGRAVAHFGLRMAVALRGLQDALRKL